MVDLPDGSQSSELIDAARAGDREAFGELYLRYRGAATTYARHLTGSETRAADLVSEAFVKVLGQLDRGHGPNVGFLSYLTTTIRNLNVDGHRREAKQVLVENMADFLPADRTHIRDFALLHAETGTLLLAFATLPDGWREVLWRVEVLGQYHDEVSSAVGITANAVGVTAFRAREGLREAYLAQHLNVNGDKACREVAVDVPRYIRGSLGSGRTARLVTHLRSCEYCPAAVEDVRQINSNLAGRSRLVDNSKTDHQRHATAESGSGDCDVNDRV